MYCFDIVFFYEALLIFIEDQFFTESDFSLKINETMRTVIKNKKIDICYRAVLFKIIYRM